MKSTWGPGSIMNVSRSNCRDMAECSAWMGAEFVRKQSQKAGNGAGHVTAIKARSISHARGPNFQIASMYSFHSREEYCCDGSAIPKSRQVA